MLATRRLVGAPAGETITAQLRDGDEILATVVTVTPDLDENGDPFDAYIATFDEPARPYALEWLQDGVRVSYALITDDSGASSTTRERLERMVAADELPTLTTEDIDDLLAGAQRTDGDGFAPTDDGWTPTFDLNAAAAAGWRRKAGLAASGFDFGEDGQHFNRSQIYAHCIAMAADYRKLAGRRSAFVAVTLVSPYSGDDETAEALV